MDLARIQEMADDEMTPYNGDFQETYSGFGDTAIDFGDPNLSFATEWAKADRFTISLTNNIQAAKTVLLCPSYIPSLPAGNANGAPMLTGAVVTVGGITLTAAGSPKTIEEFLAFITYNPSRLIGMKIVSNSVEQLAQQIGIQRKSPYRTLADEFIDLASYTVETNQNDKMVTLKNLAVQFDTQTEIRFPMPASDGVTPIKTTVTFYMGAAYNIASSLNRKAEKAGKHPQVAQARMALATR